MCIYYFYRVNPFLQCTSVLLLQGLHKTLSCCYSECQVLQLHFLPHHRVSQIPHLSPDIWLKPLFSSFRLSLSPWRLPLSHFVYCWRQGFLVAAVDLCPAKKARHQCEYEHQVSLHLCGVLGTLFTAVVRSVSLLCVTSGSDVSGAQGFGPRLWESTPVT